LTALFLTALGLHTAVHLWLSRRQERCVARHRNAVPPEFADSVTPEAHRKAADYTIARTRFGRVGLVVRAMVLLGFTLGGGLDALARLLPPDGVSRGTAFVLAAFFLAGAVRLPLDVYRTFRLEARFGFNRTTPRLFLLDLLRGAALGLVIGGALTAGALRLMRDGGHLWWVWLSLGWVGVSFLFAWAYPVLIAPIFHRFTPLAEGETRRRLERLLAAEGFESAGMKVMDGSRRSTHANAYFAGLGARKRIVLFDTLLAQLAPDEIEAVLAHELGHSRLHHIRRRILGGALLSFCGLAAFAFLRDRGWFYEGLGVTRPSDAAALVMFIWVGPVFAFLIGPLSAAWSRRHEYEADAFAAARTGAAPMIRALVRLYEGNASTLTPDPLHSAFHDSHPPAPLRIGRLRELDRRATSR
jgi:STE24 endopeptidase